MLQTKVGLTKQLAVLYYTLHVLVRLMCRARQKAPLSVVSVCSSSLELLTGLPVLEKHYPCLQSADQCYLLCKRLGACRFLSLLQVVGMPCGPCQSGSMKIGSCSMPSGSSQCPCFGQPVFTFSLPADSSAWLLEALCCMRA